MSKEKLQAFAEAVSRSEELQKRFFSIQQEAAKSTAGKLAELSRSAGTAFTAEEYVNAAAESSEELSAEQLHTVAGGWSDDQIRDAVRISLMTFGVGCIVYGVASLVNPNNTKSPACRGDYLKFQ
jgi:hypothetical protein